ncbi:hypothetical protein [Auritidibacter sp. NML100628]|uniref:hypothetical protein n=1 Tax=Auritidibacter sp. NML100628 TaxID=2170742 RepID=UPI000D728756|nr:hypothetical protein [Auritidibacter sp. NML100628]PXA76089.1 hypothetical protein DCC24_08990 [Auritidibacter sp. NML100628]PXA81193.1 hypothetical protein DCC26_03105 [Auritidibacter sp. NML120779]
MKNKFAAIALIVLALLFIFLGLTSAIGFISSQSTLANLIGWAVIVMLLFGIWALMREWRFGAGTERLAKILDQEGGLPVDDLPRGKYNKIDQAAADEDFEIYRIETQNDPENWRSWFRLGLAYDAAGDRRRARQALNKAIKMEAGQD